MRSQQLDVALELGLDVLKDWLDRVAVRVAWFTTHQNITNIALYAFSSNWKKTALIDVGSTSLA